MLVTLTVVFVIGILFMLFLLTGGALYSRTGWNKNFFHDVMGRHAPTKNITFNDVSYYSRCKYCKKKIMQDSKGKWF